jgi:hypothetical protein
MSTKNAVFREGISAGLIGATSIAVWFAIIDAISGHLLATPVMLGTSLGSLVLQGASTPSTAAAFLGYTVFHFALFSVIGLAFSFVVNGSERVPSAFIGFGMLFVAFEVGWVGWTMVLAEGFGSLTWLQVFIANLIASVAMGFYMWRQHPTLPRRVTEELAGVGVSGD